MIRAVAIAFARRSRSPSFRQISWTYKKLKEGSWLVLLAVSEKTSVESPFFDKTTTKVSDRRITDFHDDSSSVDCDFAGNVYRWSGESSAANVDAFHVYRWKSLL